MRRLRSKTKLRKLSHQRKRWSLEQHLDEIWSKRSKLSLQLKIRHSSLKRKKLLLYSQQAKLWIMNEKLIANSTKNSKKILSILTMMKKKVRFHQIWQTLNLWPIAKFLIKCKVNLRLMLTQKVLRSPKKLKKNLKIKQAAKAINLHSKTTMMKNTLNRKITARLTNSLLKTKRGCPRRRVT